MRKHCASCTTCTRATGTCSIPTLPSRYLAGRASRNKISPQLRESFSLRRIPPSSPKSSRAPSASARRCPNASRRTSTGRRNQFPFPTVFPSCRNFYSRPTPDIVLRSAGVWMKLLIAIVGLFILFATLWEAFETIILPRRVTRPIRLVRMFYRVTWKFWAAVNRLIRSKKVRDAQLSYYGPLSLLGLFATWAFLLILAFSMLHWAAGSAINAPGETPTFRTDFYLSGTTFFTLGLGDVTPRTTLAKANTVTEGGTGFGFLGLMISYLPTLYGAFSQRELNISLLDARAGSPPTAAELLRRHAQFADNEVLTPYLRDWEIWAAQLMESHLSYPVLCYFRSQHDNQSWLAAFAAVLDVSALLIAYGDGTAKWQSQLTFAIARHAVVDLAGVLRHSASRPG